MNNALTPLIDRFGRKFEYLRLSVTDRCDLRCTYCLPKSFKGYQEPKDWLTFDEIDRVVGLFTRLGTSRVRMTGGEPLLRRNLPELAARLSALPGLSDLSLSTNGTQLPRHAKALRAAGVRRLNISLDTLSRECMTQITGRDSLDDVMAGLAAAQEAGFSPIKLNMVVMPEVNAGEVQAMTEFCLQRGFILRLIETMPVGATGLAAGYAPLGPIIDDLRTRFNLIPEIKELGGGPARYWRTADGQVRVTHPVVAGQHVRLLGEDIAAGSEVLVPGQRLAPQHLALAASVGVGALEVFRRLHVGVLFTGDELTEPGVPLAPGAIYNSNRYAIVSLLHRMGCVVADYGIVRDSARATREALSRAASENDVIITCGGVSVGEEDHVKAAVQALGQLDLWQISMKPGKPLAYGRIGAADFIGLPGNPVSAFVTFLLLARPFLQRRMGLGHTGLHAIEATAGFELPRPDRRREFLRVRFDPASNPRVLQMWPNQSSGVMSSIAWADGLVDVPASTTIRAGDTVRYIPLSTLMD